MKKTILGMALATCLTTQAQYQLPNSDFESDFVKAYYNKPVFSAAKTYYEPQYWHGFPTGEFGTFTSAGRSGDKLNASSDVRPGSTGKQSVVLTATSLLGYVANGIMTTGRVSAKSTTADDANQNFNYSEPGLTDTSNSNENSSFSQTFTGHPDAFRFWAKFDAASGTQSSAYPYASVNAVITTRGRYQDPETKDYSDIKVAQAVNREMANYGTWHEYTLPFDYTVGNSDDSQYILITFTTNATPAKGTNGDKLYVDDIEMIYNSELTGAEYAGAALDDQPRVVEGAWDEALLTCTTNAHAATVESSYDAAADLLTVTVKGEDISVNPTNQHIYTYPLHCYIPGDVNRDGVVDRADVTALVNHIIGEEGTAIDTYAADLNGNGNIDILDVAELIDRLLD